MRKQIIIIALIIILIPVGKEIIFKHYRLALNPTKSIPGKLFLYKINNNARFNIGDLIVFKVKDDDIYYPNKNFLKIVAGKSGDRLRINNRRYSINSYQVKAKEKSLNGSKLKQFLPQKNIIAKNSYFVIGVSKHSYDSRYFGLVTKKTDHW